MTVATTRTPSVVLTEPERKQLEIWARSRNLPDRLVMRSRIVLLASAGLTPEAVAARLRVAPGTVRLWVRRFAGGGPAAIQRDAPGRGRPAGTRPARALRVLTATRARLAAGIRPTARLISADTQISAASVWRVWKQYAIAPNRTEDFSLKALDQLISETRTRCT